MFLFCEPGLETSAPTRTRVGCLRLILVRGWEQRTRPPPQVAQANGTGISFVRRAFCASIFADKTLDTPEHLVVAPSGRLSTSTLGAATYYNSDPIPPRRLPPSPLKGYPEHGQGPMS